MKRGDIRIFRQMARFGLMVALSRLLGIAHWTTSRLIAQRGGCGRRLCKKIASRRLNLITEGRQLLAVAEQLETITGRDVMALNKGDHGIGRSARLSHSLPHLKLL